MKKQKIERRIKPMKHTSTVFKEICPYCQKEIISLYETQVKANMDFHKVVCKLNPQNLNKEELKSST
jgi:hypothetical protein